STAGSAPIGIAAPALSVLPDRPDSPGMSRFAPADPSPAEPLPAEPEPAGAVLELGLVGVGFGDGFALATVMVGAVAAAVSRAPPVSVTSTVALYLTVSPAVAVFGTVIWVSTWGCDGLAVGTVRLQVVPLVVVQLSTVNAGAVNAGVVLLGVTVEVILPTAPALRFV